MKQEQLVSRFPRRDWKLLYNYSVGLLLGTGPYLLLIPLLLFFLFPPLFGSPVAGPLYRFLSAILGQTPKAGWLMAPWRLWWLLDAGIGLLLLLLWRTRPLALGMLTMNALLAFAVWVGLLVTPSQWLSGIGY